MSAERRQLRLILWVMLGLSVIVTSFVTTYLYQTAFDQQRLRLVEVVQSRARLLESIAEFDAQYSRDYPGGSEAATISQIRQAHSNFRGFGESGEFTLARLVGDQIQFIIQHRHDELSVPEPVALDADLAHAMKRAVNGESGTMTGLDYRGQMVLSAYEPVAILDLGLVAKIDLAEIRQPFIISGSLALLVAIILILIGISIISKLGRPIIQQLEKQASNLQETIKARTNDLQSHAQLLRGILEYAPDAILIVDNKAIIIETNRILDELFGYDPGELIGEELGILIPEEFHQSHTQHHKHYFENPNSRSMGSGLDLSGLKKDGSVFPVDISLNPVQTDNGILITASVRDMTEQKKTINGLQIAKEDAEDKTRIMFKVFMDATDPIIIEDLDGNIIDLNREAEVIYGFPREELLGQSIKTLVPPERHAQANDILQRCKRGEEVRNIEGLRWDKEHRITPVLLTLSQLKNELGQTIAIATIAKDITEQKHIEAELQKERQHLEQSVEERTKELKENQQLLGAIIENCGAVFYLKDLEGRYQMVNKEWETLVGMKREDAVGKTDDVFWPAEAAVIRKNDKEVLEKKALLRREEVVTAGDGSVRTFLSFKIPMYGQDCQLNGLCGISTDITEQKELQVQLEDSKLQAEAATLAKDNFLASMSHEIRTPMNAIVGLVDLLRQSNLGDDEEHMLQTISDSGQSLLTIINDILDFSKIEAGKMSLESIPMSLSDLVDSSAEILSPSLKPKPLRLLTYVDPDLPQFVIGDPVRIRQILINLGSNAIKFSEQGNVEIRVERWKNEDPDMIHVRIRVIDEGIGISEDIKHSLFESFTQAETSTTRKYGGTGLGLSICQRLTEMMGGVIGVNSEPGKGAEFFVHLEFKPSDKTMNQGKVKDLSGLRIQLIVNNEKERDIYVRYLEFWNAEVVVSENITSEEPLNKPDKEEANPFDIVIIGSQWSKEEQYKMQGNIIGQQAYRNARFMFLRKGSRHSGSRIISKTNVALDVDPVGRAMFLSTVAIAAGRASPETHYEEKIGELKASQVPTQDEALKQGTLILVAEDNPTNQDVIRRQLNLFGYACELVNDGQQALSAWRNKDYAMLLTDCHMPNMDGFELTKQIREEERGIDKRAIIIAITANALQGEVERCFAAGMDDYLSKPVNLTILKKKLNKWMPQSQPDSSYINGSGVRQESDECSRHRQASYPIDDQMLKGMFGDDPDIFKEILTDFVQPSRNIVKEIHNGCEERSAELIKEAAHKLKSAARSIGANALADTCTLLEKAGEDEDWETINENIDQSDRQMTEVETYINKL